MQHPETQAHVQKVLGKSNVNMSLPHTWPCKAGLLTAPGDADLDQAIQKAMQAIGQEPVPLSRYTEPQNREEQLLARIARLETQLAAKA